VYLSALPTVEIVSIVLASQWTGPRMSFIRMNGFHLPML
jgi:hypothetical protein